jgi:hypothetical protein
LPPKIAIPVRHARTADHFRQTALKRLKERFEAENKDEEFDPSGEPVITPLLKSCEGGISRVMEALRAHDDDDARSFMELYDNLTAKDRQYLTLEEIAVAAGIGSLRLAEISTSAMIKYGELHWKLTLSAGMGRVVETMLRQAVKPKGYADREWALKSGGVLPMPKGAQIAIQNNTTIEKDDKDAGKGEAVWLHSEERLRIIHDAVEQRRLPSPPAVPLSIGGRLDHMQTETAEIIRKRDL